ncbi:uncharacterized protein Z520_03955 [Fonsecaea multimorphosa CBS 102226]|uniref:Major facilitator superfamily (MFS) profile domain-containing protein n=1 Tax=Fonsecaea multimorphosa CBS 102226 TaxID=1442371 RepID=A0A0D2KAU4_9EURO|nr:uncharacterized protein Z520_03955 [Fonsecaea multimorphosa CBS 102226]KIY00270.1 hypothetical protein Z520_03955 [Fonsecaea multimorphosa CBS 102226]
MAPQSSNAPHQAMAAGEAQFTWRGFWIAFLISLGQLAAGYPSALIGTTLGEPSFLIYMGLYTKGATGSFTPTTKITQLIGAMNGVYQAGAVIGVLGAPYIMDRWGRRAGFVYASTFSILGGAIVTGSNGVAMFITARFFVGLGAWAFVAITPTYTAEVAPPRLRGFFVGLNGVCVTLGYGLGKPLQTFHPQTLASQELTEAPAAYMGMAFYYAPYGEVQWRVPLGLALVFPLAMLVITWFLPESPRWLLLRGRGDEARAVIMDLHSVKGDPDCAFARAEFYQISQQVEIDRTMNPSWLEIFRRPSYRKRAILAMGFAFLGQSTAELVINNYGPLLYSELGYGTEDQLRFQCGWITTIIITNILSALIMDKIGRKPLMLTAIFGCCACLILETVVVAVFTETGTNKVGLAFGVVALYLLIAFNGIGVDSCGYVWYTEIFPNHIRAKGLSVCVATLALTNLLYLQVSATAFQHIGKYN